MSDDRFDFELDHEVGFGPMTAHGGVPVLLEYFRSSGAASIVDRDVCFKRRQRGLSPSRMVESLLALWACGGEPCEDLEHLRGEGLSHLLGHDLPAPQTARDFLAAFDELDLPCWAAASRRCARRAWPCVVYAFSSSTPSLGWSVTPASGS